MNNTTPIYRLPGTSPQVFEDIQRHRENAGGFNPPSHTLGAIRRHPQYQGNIPYQQKPHNPQQQNPGNFQYHQQSPTPQQKNSGNVSRPQQNPNNNQPSRSPLAPYTANVFGGQASFQPIPSFSFSPRTHAGITASLTPVPGGPSASVSATAWFDPKITISPTETGGINLSFTPKGSVEVGANLKLGVPEIFGTKVGLNFGGNISQGFTIGGPELSTNLNPDGSFDVNANFNPSFTSDQTIGGQAGLEAKAFGVDIAGSQGISHQTEQEIRIGGPGVQYSLSSVGEPKLSQNFDKTISITNSYTVGAKTEIEGSIGVGPVTGTAGVAVTPTFTVQHTVTFSTDLSRRTPPKHEVSAMPGVHFDGSLGISVSLLPKAWPVNIAVNAGFAPRATISGPKARYSA